MGGCVGKCKKREGRFDECRERALANVLQGALMAQAAISALSLPHLEQTHWGARMSFTISLVISLLAIFFTCIQHRSLGFLRRPIELRAWLSNGTRYRNSSNDIVFQSSMVAHQLLHAPYELVGISLTAFIGGLGTYLGSAWLRDVEISVRIAAGKSVQVGNLGVLVCYLVGTGFACAMFGFLVGGKSVEMRDAVVRMEDLFQSPVTRVRERNMADVSEDGIPFEDMRVK